MNFSFAKGTPKQLMTREFKKITGNIRFILKQCFPCKPTPTRKWHSAIQCHHKKLRVSIKDILFELATSYKLMNPIRGIVPGSPFKRNIDLEVLKDDIDKKLESEHTEWQKEVFMYTNE
jgi:hypothetical protein